MAGEVPFDQTIPLEHAPHQTLRSEAPASARAVAHVHAIRPITAPASRHAVRAGGPRLADAPHRTRSTVNRSEDRQGCVIIKPIATEPFPLHAGLRTPLSRRVAGFLRTCIDSFRSNFVRALNASPLLTIYLRRRGDHAYAVAIHAVTRPASADQFCARLVNMVRLGPGQTVPVKAELQPEFGATRDEAFSRIESAIETWRTASSPPLAAGSGAGRRHTLPRTSRAPAFPLVQSESRCEHCNSA
jgi:hypothetical protein